MDLELPVRVDLAEIQRARETFLHVHNPHS